MNKIRVVFALGQNNNGTHPFGLNDGLPWEYIQEDFDMFRDTTEHHVVVMGYKTWMSLPCKLKNRINVVISSARDAYEIVNAKYQLPDHVILENDLVPGRFEKKLREISEFHNKDVNVIGGLGVIGTAMEFADEVHLTKIKSTTRYEYTVGIDQGSLNAMLTNNPAYEVQEVYELQKRGLHGRSRKRLSKDSPVTAIRRTIYTRKVK
ncbi:MAG: dihydrofolate reductase [Bacilli bacterium]